jgi:valyl-tRNA synthetase
MGWDDNGLPTERRVQNIYNVRADPHALDQPDLVIGPVPDGVKPTEPPEPTVISRRRFIELCHRVTANSGRSALRALRIVGTFVILRVLHFGVS